MLYHVNSIPHQTVYLCLLYLLLLLLKHLLPLLKLYLLQALLTHEVLVDRIAEVYLALRWRI